VCECVYVRERDITGDPIVIGVLFGTQYCVHRFPVACACVCVCVCEREREREREGGKERERESVYERKISTDPLVIGVSF